MAVNKVQKSTGDVIIDLTGDTIRPDVVAKGYIGHGPDGVQFAGTMTPKTLFYTEASSAYTDTYEIRFPVPTGQSAAELLANNNLFLMIQSKTIQSFTHNYQIIHSMNRCRGNLYAVYTTKTASGSLIGRVIQAKVTEAATKELELSAGSDNTIVHRASASNGRQFHGDYEAVIGLL